MGIKGLHKFIRDKFPNVLTEIHLSHFAYEIVAVDISMYIYRYKSISSKYWLSFFVNLIGCLRRNHIHCIFIYDSKAPPEKDEERKKRREELEKRNIIITQLEDAIECYKDNGIILDCLKDFADKQGNKAKKILIEGINISFIEDKVQRMRTQICCITEDDIKKTKELFDILDVPYIDAPGEAEAMASKLCRRNKVKAVLSEDSDVLAYRSPLLLTKIDTRRDTCIQIEYKKLLELMEWTSSQFIDFCIMCGTDYNKNIPKIGPINAYKLINEYNNIDRIKEEKKYDITILNHIRVRQLLRHPRSYKIQKKYCGKPHIVKLKSFYEKNGLSFYEDSIIKNFFKEDIILEDDNIC